MSADPKDCEPYLKIGDAALYLGISTSTLRNWDKSGRLKPVRSPDSDYRIYSLEQLARFKKKPPSGTMSGAEPSVRVSGKDIRIDPDD